MPGKVNKKTCYPSYIRHRCTHDIRMKTRCTRWCARKFSGVSGNYFTVAVNYACHIFLQSWVYVQQRFVLRLDSKRTRRTPNRISQIVYFLRFRTRNGSIETHFLRTWHVESVSSCALYMGRYEVRSRRAKVMTSVRESLLFISLKQNVKKDPPPRRNSEWTLTSLKPLIELIFFFTFVETRYNHHRGRFTHKPNLCETRRVN